MAKIINWHDFFEHTEKEITTLKITPDRTVSNDRNISLTKAFSELYKSPIDRIKVNFKDIQIIYLTKDKVYFDIIFEPGQAYFYLSIPSKWVTFIRTKAENIWDKCTIEAVDKAELIEFDISQSQVCDLRLVKHDIFSLQTSHNDLYPLTSMMSVLNDMQGTDKIRVSYVFDPQNRLDWQQSADGIYKEYQKGHIPKRFSISKEDAMEWFGKLMNFAVDTYIQVRLIIFESLFFIFTERESKLEKLLRERDERQKKITWLPELSDPTLRKLTLSPFKSFIRIISQSEDNDRRKINLRTVANSFKDLAGDNELKMVELNKKQQSRRFREVLKFLSSRFVEKNIFSDEEVSKFIQLPQVTLQEQYRIQSIDTRETDVPSELQGGIIPVGLAEKQGRVINATWPKDKNICALPKIVIGPQNAGKTAYTTNFTIGAYKSHDATIVLDYIQDCELSKAIEKQIPDQDRVIINMSDNNQLFSLAYTEASKQITGQSSNWDRLRIANLLSGQVEYLINSVTDEATGELTAPMLRYLYAAAMVTFIHPGKTINDMFQVLRKWQIRNEYIRQAKYSSCFQEDDEIFYDLEELHDRDKDGKIIGTRENLIIGILNRITVLNKNIYVKAMLKAAPNDDIDFIKFIEQGKAVLVRIPQVIFPDVKIRDALATYFMGRIWLAVQLRRQGNNRLCHVIIDEVHQIPTCASFIKNHITEFRRHRLGTLFTVHYLKQFRALLDAIKSAGASYMLLAGTEKDNLKALEEEIKPFTVEEGLSLKPFHSLNIINYGNQYAKFISQLPKPLK